MRLLSGSPERIADTFGRSFFALPSSIHECIIVPETVEGFWGIFGLSGRVNRYVCRKREYLSDNVYYYDRKKERFFWLEFYL